MNSKYDYVGSVTRKTYWYDSPTPQQVGYTVEEITAYLIRAVIHFLFIMPLVAAANENSNPQPDGGDTGNSGEQPQ